MIPVRYVPTMTTEVFGSSKVPCRDLARTLLMLFIISANILQLKEPREEPKEESKKQSKHQPKYQTLICRSCHAYIGHRDHQAEGYRLYKWRLKTTVPSPLPYSQPSTPSIITAQLQSIMLAQCSSRLLLVPMTWVPSSRSPSPSSHRFLNLWILNPSLRYSSTSTSTSTHSSSPRQQPILAMKIFSKPISSPSEAAKILDTEGVEEVSLPEDTIMEIAACLGESRACLPPSAREFRGWDVGLLERFEGGGGGG